MSVYIKGMEMPTGCLSCDFCNPFVEEPYCRRLMQRAKGAARLPNCPLIPVPDHGRLIDADEADSRYVPYFTDLTDFQCGWNEAMKRVCDESPTVIPAEPPKEET